jgi:hypothetical protein
VRFRNDRSLEGPVFRSGQTKRKGPVGNSEANTGNLLDKIPSIGEIRYCPTWPRFTTQDGQSWGEASVKPYSLRPCVPTKLILSESSGYAWACLFSSDALSRLCRALALLCPLEP